ncbi:hypothetical protein ACTMU2_36255 [Cupriavidus basilensis]
MTRLLLGMGLRGFSMHPAQLLRVKQRSPASPDCTRLQPLVDQVLEAYEPEEQGDRPGWLLAKLLKSFRRVFRQNRRTDHHFPGGDVHAKFPCLTQRAGGSESYGCQFVD